MAIVRGTILFSLDFMFAEIFQDVCRFADLYGILFSALTEY
jgi:hypothetical protein